MKKVLTLTLCLLMLLILAACSGHQHTFDSRWNSDENEHWHEATCEHTDQVSGKGAHTFEEGQDICTVCGYEKDHEHSFADTWTSDANNHWHATTCGHTDTKDKAAHVDADKNGICDVCEYVTCEHTYELASDATHHWYAPTCGCELEIKDKAEHADENEDSICDVCERVLGHIGYEDDGVCDDCGEVIFRLFNVTVNLSGNATLLDMAGNALATELKVKEESNVEFQIVVPAGHRLEDIEIAELGEPVYNADGSITYTVLFKATNDDMVVNVVIHKLSAAEIIKEDSFKAEVPGGDRYYHLLPVAVEEDGKYAVVSYNDNFNVGAEDWVYGGWDDNPFYGKFVYTFDGKAGQTVNVKFYNAGYDPLTEDVRYAVLKIDTEFELPYLKGEGYSVPSSVNITVTVTLPKKGLYVFTSQLGELVWLEGPDDTGVGDESAKVIEATEDNQKVSLTFRVTSTNKTIIDFDWEIIEIQSVGTLNFGDNTVYCDKEPTGYVGYTFTAPYTGSYVFTCGQGVTAYVWQEVRYNSDDSDDSETISKYQMVAVDVQTLNKGDVLTVYTIADPYAPGIEAAFDGTLNIQFAPAYDAELGGYNAVVGIQNNFNADGEADGYYLVQLPNGGQISLDGVNYISIPAEGMDIPIDGAVSYYVKGADGAENVLVKLTMYTFTVDVNDQATWTQTMKPGVAYTVTLSGAVGAEMGKNTVYAYKLSWTDANIKMLYNGNEIISGTEISSWSDPNATITLIYSGDAAADITFTLVDPDAGSNTPVGNVLTVGTQTVNATYNGIEYTFTAKVDGTYAITWIPGNTFVQVQTAYGAEEIDPGYEFTLASGESIVFIMCTNGGDDTYDVTVSLKEEETAGNVLVLGTTTVNATYAGTPYTFTAKIDGTYVVTWTYDLAYVMVDKGMGGEQINSGTEFTLKSGESFEILASTDGDDAYEVTVSLKEEEPAGNVLILGTVTVNATYAGTPYTFTAKIDGTYVVTWTYDLAYVMVDKGMGGEQINSGTEFTLKSGESFEILASTDGDDTYEVTVSLKEEESEEKTELALRTNTLTPGENGLDMTFTSEDGGTYTITLQGNGVVYIGVESDKGGMAFEDACNPSVPTYTFTLEAGQTVTFRIKRWSGKPEDATVTVVIEKK